jgi:hypothetical protein
MPHSDSGLDPAVVHFVVVAKQFCQILETEITPLNRELVQRLLEAILALYTAGLTLPDAESEYQESLCDRDTRHRFLKTVAEKLNGDLYYQEMFEPLDLDVREPVTGSLSDDLTDIYFDVKEGLMRISDDGVVPAHVIWAWAFGLESHWGRHAVGAITALHSLLFGEHAVS